jgi:TatD DNase family protein
MNFFNFHTHKFTNQPDAELVNQYPQEFDDAIPFIP